MRIAFSLCLLLFAVMPLAAQSNSAAAEQHIEAAQQAQANQDCATAAKEYAAAVHLLPSSGELRTNEGIALYCDHRYSETIPVLRKALSLNPSLTVPHLFLGLASFHLSDMATATNQLETAVRLMPKDVTSHLWLGYAYFARQQNERAGEAFQAVLRLQPQNVDARYALGQAYFEIGRRRTIDLARLAPKGRGIRLLAAEQQAMKSGAALKETEGTPATFKNVQEEQLYREAVDAEEKAQATLQKLLDEAPESDRAHEIQGDAYSLQRNNNAAIREYDEVLRINPSLPGVRLALANCLMQADRFNEALAALTEEQHLTPRSADVWASTGRVQLALGKDAEAITSLKKAVSLPDAPPAARMLLGKSLLRTGEAKEALVYLEQALREGADPATTNYLLARAYRSLGNHEAMNKALQAYQRSSQDEAERQSAAAFIQRPTAVQTSMSAQETQEASSMSAQHD